MKHWVKFHLHYCAHKGLPLWDRPEPLAFLSLHISHGSSVSLATDQVSNPMRIKSSSIAVETDIQSTFRIEPVDPEDQQRLGHEWKGTVYIDTTSPFGLCSSPRLFNSLAAGLQWIT